MKSSPEFDEAQQKFFQRYYIPVIIGSFICCTVALVVNLFFVSEVYIGHEIIRICLLLFFILVFVLRNKLSAKHKELVLIIASLSLAVNYLFSPFRDHLEEVSTSIFWLNELSMTVGFLIIAIGGIVKIYSDKVKSLRISNITGLGNARWMTDYVNRRIQEGIPQGSLLLIDVRNFRIINSIFGRKYGDKLIKIFADLLRPIIDDNHKIAHIGGIEFCVWVEDVDKEAIRRRLKGLDPAVKQKIRETGENVNVFIKTAGAFYPEDGRTFSELLCSANIAMEQTILNAQFSHVFYSPEMEKDLKTESVYIYELQRAIENKDFFICYQEKCSIDGKTVYGVEALARWNSDVLGEVSPAVFVPLIYKAGMIDSFTELIISEILYDVPAINSIYGTGTQVSINIPPSFFMNYSFLDYIRKMLDQTSVDPSRITFEITEDIFIDGMAEINRIIEELQLLGIRISLDDFGTGFSSLSYIQNLPIQELKIDKSFIENIDENEKDFILVKAICDIAHSNNYMIVAEGVETEAQLRLLKQTSCDLIQGYIYSKPSRLAENKVYSL